MRKDSITDYALAAFFAYARYGRRGEREMREYFYHRARFLGESHLEAMAEVKRNAPLIADIAAVDKTLEILGAEDGAKRLAVETVYVTKAGVASRDIAARVRAVAGEIPTSERTVYRWLAYAREVFAKERGLSLKGCQ